MQVNGISGEQSYRPAEAKEASEAVNRPGAEKTPEQKKIDQLKIWFLDLLL